jgi:alpha-glucosidase
VDGFRLDVFNLYFRDDQFRNNPPLPKEKRAPGLQGLRAYDRQDHIYDCDRPEMIPAVQEIRSILDEKPGRYVVGELLLPTVEKAVRYCGPDRLHQAFNFRFLECPWDAQQFLRVLIEWQEALGDNWPSHVLGNHDRKRIAARYARGEEDDRLKVAAALLLTQRGTPFIYYGDEIGMRDIHLNYNEILDPIGKRYWPYPAGRDGCRSPMQWDGSIYAGFSQAKPWLKVHPDHTNRNVTAQQDEATSLFYFYRALIHLRKAHPALLEGDFIPLTNQPKKGMAYLRRCEEETILVALNFSHREQELGLDPPLAAMQWETLLSTYPGTEPAVEDGSIWLQGSEALILRMKDEG